MQLAQEKYMIWCLCIGNFWNAMIWLLTFDPFFLRCQPFTPRWYSGWCRCCWDWLLTTRETPKKQRTWSCSTASLWDSSTPMLRCCLSSLSNSLSTWLCEYNSLSMWLCEYNSLSTWLWVQFTVYVMWLCKYNSLSTWPCEYNSLSMWLCKYNSLSMWLCEYNSLSMWPCEYNSLLIWSRSFSTV